MSFCRACRSTSNRLPATRQLSSAAPRKKPDLPPKYKSPLPKQGRETGDSLPSLLQTLANLKSQSRTPRSNAYITIIKTAGDFALSRSVEGDETDNMGWQIALAAWRDAKNGGLDLGQEGLDSLLRFTLIYPHLLPSLLLYSEGDLPSTYHNLTRAAASNSNPEQMIYLLTEMFNRNITPSLATVKHAVKLACEWGYPRLALQIVEKVEQESRSALRLDQSAWVEILIASADSQYLHGVETAWNRVKRSYTPDEGLVLAMLNTAGRWGRPDLASTLLELPAQPQEQHLAPLLEAFCNAGEVPNAFHVLTSIRDAGIFPTMATVQPIVNVLKDAEVIDQAFYALEDMYKAGQPVDITAVNALIDASARLGDLQRVRGTQTALADLGLTPNIDTLNLVLSCCVTAKHRPLGDTILSEMVSANISPDATTYENLIMLCLTQPTFEDAFYYLEKTKAEGFKPTYAIYDSLVRKCITMDDSRWRLVVDELKAVGYRIDTDLHEFINSGGKIRSREGRRRANDQMIGGKRRQWISQNNHQGAEAKSKPKPKTQAQAQANQK